MSCCGEKRMALVGDRSTAFASRRVAPASAARPSILHANAAGPHDVMLRYLGAGSFSTRSLRTGRAYHCAATGAHIAVDPQDAEYLVFTRQFARER